MMNNPLVSIIIPTYNRANLITETLNSILMQSYENWECIVVDDGSTDNTKFIVDYYKEKDSRFQYHIRPKNRMGGGNAARNYGFELSKGEFIQWFDDDDLMDKNKIKKKLDTIISFKCDFVISKTQNFTCSSFQSPYKYNLKENKFDLFLFLIRNIHWYTYDCMLSREVASQISFFEKMKSWQDYYYFAKMLSISNNGIFIDEILTYRRLHENSIQDNIHRSESEFHKNLLFAKFYTYKEIRTKLNLKQKKSYFKGCINHSFYLMRYKYVSNLVPEILLETLHLYKFKNVLLLVVGYILVFITGKGEGLVNKIK
ncbi:glycosyltransferase family 2 protein [Flavobacterium frigidimaris]|uniref:Glycosyltransferase 2-like domain-containing protein n=1 Tax=Flavobacterium frigidimaris TaxID=262320 RepID=A0ABX4BVR2_FLAFR|nr:glycosyltransferase family 2 protein [Flavobacterium frigidimaris]OXA81459.1 hypothetical protein B0A65_04165 [Flavobacterium frigidimaris]